MNLHHYYTLDVMMCDVRPNFKTIRITVQLKKRKTMNC